MAVLSVSVNRTMVVPYETIGWAIKISASDVEYALVATTPRRGLRTLRTAMCIDRAWLPFTVLTGCHRSFPFVPTLTLPLASDAADVEATGDAVTKHGRSLAIHMTMEDPYAFNAGVLMNEQLTAFDRFKVTR